MEELARRYRVVVPNLRGYGRSLRPARVADYRIEHLVTDLLDLIQEEPVRLVGHDWGGVIAWTLAAHRPDLVTKLALLNSPHPEALEKQLWSEPRQLMRSWYMFFYQLPWLPEQIILRNTLRWLLSFHPGSREYLRAVAESLAHPGAASAALNYYRAAFRYKRPRLPRVQVPTLMLWGMKDKALGTASALASARYVEAAFDLHFWSDAGHWPQLDQPEKTCRVLSSFLSAESTEG